MLSVLEAKKTEPDIDKVKRKLEAEHHRVFFIDIYPASDGATRRWEKLSKLRAGEPFKPAADFVLLANRSLLTGHDPVSKITVCTEIEVFYHAAKAELCAAGIAFARIWQNTIIVPFRNYKQVLMSTVYHIFDSARHFVDLVQARTTELAAAAKPVPGPAPEGRPRQMPAARSHRQPAP